MKKKILAMCLMLFAPLAAIAMTGQEILSQSGVKGGLVVCVGKVDPGFLMGLHVNDWYLVHGLIGGSEDRIASRDKIKEIREAIQTKGLYGKVTVNEWDKKRLPYVDNLVNLIVVSAKSKVPNEEIMRVLAPLGVAYINGKKIVKPWPKEMDQWPHYLNKADNNAVSGDLLAGPPKHMKWVADPVWARHHDKLASISSVVTSKGRMFYVVDHGPAHSPGAEARERAVPGTRVPRP